MLDPYRMVYFNIISLIILIAVLILFSLILKKKINYFYTLIIFSILPIISVFRKGVYESGDFNIHIYRSISFYESLKNFIFFPSWRDGVNAGFGYTIFLFINRAGSSVQMFIFYVLKNFIITSVLI